MLPATSHKYINRSFNFHLNRAKNLTARLNPSGKTINSLGANEKSTLGFINKAHFSSLFIIKVLITSTQDITQNNSRYC